MDLLLTHGYFLYKDDHEKRIMKPYPPLGILYLSSYLKSKGFAVEVFDSTFRSKEEFCQFIDDFRPRAVGIYGNLMTKLNVLEMITYCKSRGVLVILGGPEPSSYAEEFLGYGADVIVLGEGEKTLQELLEVIDRGGIHRLHSVRGCVFKDDQGIIHRTLPRELIRDLDSIPFPDREAITIDEYVETWRRFHGMGSVSLITARGCPYTCTWCSHGVYGYTHRRRSPRNVVDELELVKNRYKPDMMWIADDVFTIHHGWLQQYSEEMKRRGLRIPFECISRADRLNEDVLRLLAELGCFRLWYGSESGSQRILDRMSRGVAVSEIQQMTRQAQRFGIQVGLFVMLGYEGESIADIEETVEHLKKTNADTFLTTVAYPIKGTAYFEEIQSKVLTELPWDKRTERDVTVDGRYSKSFYWFAQRRLSNEVLAHKLSLNGNGALLKRVSARAKARIAKYGMQVTSRWKS